MSETFVQLPDDSGNTGKKVRTNSRLVGADTVHEHAFGLIEPVAGAVISPATEDTLALIKAKTDNLDVLLSTRTKPADVQAVSATTLPLPSGAATETTLGTRLAESTFTGRIGEVQASPTSNTVLDRLKQLLTGIVLAAGPALIGKVQLRNPGDTVDLGDVTNPVRVDPTGATAQPVTNAGTFVVQENGAALTSLQLIDDVVHTNDAALGKVAALGGQFDDVSPGTTTENNIRALRMSTRRELYIQLRDAAGNERGLNIDASGQIAVTNTQLAVVGGGTEATAQRVTIANDSTGVVSIDDNGGSVTVDGTVTVGQITTPTSGGASTMNATSSDGGTALTNAAQVIKASAGCLLGYYVYNPNASAAFVLFYNTAAASVTVGTTNPLFMLTIPANSAANLSIVHGITFSNAGWSWAATSTAGGNGALGTALDAVAWYA